MRISHTLFLPTPPRGAVVEIGGSVLRYVSQPGHEPFDSASVDGVTRRKHWDKLRRKVAANARIK